MNLFKHCLIITFLATTFTMYGQTYFPKSEESPYIEVTGTAEQEVIPDEIYIAITIKEKYANRVKISIEEQESKLKEAIKSLGINLENLSLSDASADYVKIKWQKKDVLTSKDYTLKVSHASIVGQVFMELEKLEITEASISKVNHSKMDSLKKEIKIKAIKDAKDKADYLLNAIGEQTGKPLIVRENEIYPIRTLAAPLIKSSRSAANISYDATIEEESNEIQFQKIKLQTSIYVKFSIK
ncbi:MAG: SIMPL domain-containing protein [Bacteroidales bacterium]|nr:SIMPL domain-containing protein [Bacteroidales bacterium]